MILYIHPRLIGEFSLLLRVHREGESQTQSLAVAVAGVLTYGDVPFIDWQVSHGLIHMGGSSHSALPVLCSARESSVRNVCVRFSLLLVAIHLVW